MKELNVVSSNVSLVFDGNKIQVSKPTENQDKILECENSIEIIKNNIEKNEKEIKENQKVMIKYGESIISLSLVYL